MNQILKKSFRFCQLKALSPLDGRYMKQASALSNYFSESALMRYRIKIECEWLLHLIENKVVPSDKDFGTLSREFTQIWSQFNSSSATRIKQIESVTNHDLKSVEYFIKENIQAHKQHIHLCCTSEDINNLSYALMVKDAMRDVMIPTFTEVRDQLINKSEEYADHVMVGRTHGQPATPTTLGKQFANFAYRIGNQLMNVEKVPITGKINGAIGNYNAHYFAYPSIDWISLNRNFIENKLQLTFNPYTTQIQPHDCLARLFAQINLYNTILIGFCRDVWWYISKGYIIQKVVKNQVGSSTMPHKVNPIDFQNCEGNLGVGNSLKTHFQEKLPISRFQRDLSDSTVLRNQGSALGYSLIGCKSLLKGLNKISSNQQLMLSDLKQYQEVITEAIQTELRKINYPQPYELLKQLSRSQSFNLQAKQKLLQKLKFSGVSEESLQKIAHLSPETYTGKASTLAKEVKSYFK